MKDTLHVRLYADSLGLPRKDYVSSNERYINLLSDWLAEKQNKKIRVLDNSKANSLITTLYTNFLLDNTYFEEADILIINEGICDCAPRPIPIRVRNLISRFPAFFRKIVIQLIHDYRPFLQKKGFCYFLTKADLFYSTYKKWLTDLANTKCQVFVFGIAPTNDLTEVQSPGFTKSIEKYNEIIKTIVNEIRAKNIHFMDVNAIIKEQNNIDEYVIKEDGHHITSLAHNLYFHLIKQSCESEKSI